MSVTASFTRNSDAYLSDGTLVRPNVPRFENGKFDKAIMVEEGTTNLLTNPFFISGLSGWSTQNVTGDNKIYVTDDVVVIKAVDARPGLFQNVNLDVGTIVTASILIKRTSGSIAPRLRWGGGPVIGEIEISENGQWVKYSATTDVQGNGNLIIEPSIADQAEYEIKAVQVEQKPYATSFTPGTRAPEALTIPTAGVLTDSGPWTVEFFGKINSYLNQTRVLFSAWPKFYVAFGHYSYALLSWMDGTQRTAYSSLSIPDVTGWHYWALSWDGTVAKVYVDAVKLIEVNTNLPSSLPSIAHIGRFGSSNVYSSLIDDLRISNIARTDEEIADAYASNQPLPKDDYTTCKLSFDLTLRDKEGKYVVYDNTPQLGYIQWENLSIGYQGMMYDIADGYTNGTYVWWDFDKPYELQSSNTLPELTEDDVLVLLNKNGTHMTVPTASVVDGGLIVPESIMADAIAANAITGNKILAGSISSDKIAAGAVGAEAIAANAIASQHIMAGAITSDHISANGIIGNKIIGGEILAGLVNIVGKDASGNSVVQIGHYEGLGPQTASFIRDSVAYKQDGTQVAANTPRFETVDGRQGLLIEEGTTNLITTPVDFSISGCTATHGYETLGSLRLSRYIENSDVTGAKVLIRSGFFPDDGTPRTVSVLAKELSGSAKRYVCIRRLTPTAGAIFDVGEGTIITTLGDVVASITPMGNDIFKCSVVFPSSSSVGNLNVGITSSTTDVGSIGYTGDGSSGILMGCLQGEEKLCSTSFTPNTRDNEHIEIPLTLSPNGGTIEVCADEAVVRPGGQAACLVKIGNTLLEYTGLIIERINTGEYRTRTRQSSGSMDTVYLGNIPGPIYIAVTWTANTIYGYINGQYIGSAQNYWAETTTNVFIGNGRISDSGGERWANTTIHDLRISNRVRTGEEIAAAYASGEPLQADEHTTYKLSFDGHLQPTVRKFGLVSKSGEIEGNIIRGSQIFGTRLQSGAEGTTSYVEIDSGDSPIEVIRNNKPALNIWTSQNIGITGGTGGIVEFYDANDGSRKGYIAAYKDTGPYGLGDGLVISAEDNNANHKDLILIGDSITLGVKNFGMFTRVYDYLEVDGDADIENLYVTGEKDAVQFTDNYGIRILSARESPDIRFEIEDIAQLENGECKVEIDPIFLECVVPHSDDYRWLVHATPYMSSMPGLYVAEIGDTYLVFRDLAGSNGQFFWRLSALRRGFENKWLEPYSDYNLDLLESNWEDEYMQLIEIEIDETVLTSGWEDELL